jgi:hypothetical protein
MQDAFLALEQQWMTRMPSKMPHMEAADTAPGTRRTVPRRATTVAMPDRDRSDKHEGVMSKGMDQKKGTKKEPTKTLKEKRAAKAEKKNK